VIGIRMNAETIKGKGSASFLKKEDTSLASA
jgi:hypothetical protein